MSDGIRHLLIDEIKVGTRFRRDLGDLDAFAAQIKAIGLLLHPIGVTPEMELIFGQRRLRASQRKRTIVCRPVFRSPWIASRQ